MTTTYLNTVRTGAMIAVYAALHLWSVIFLRQDGAHLSVWLSYGYLAALLIRLPWKAWLPIVAGALIVEWGSVLLLDAATTPVGLFASYRIVAMMVGAVLYRISGGSRDGLHTFLDVGRFIALIILLPAFLASLTEWATAHEHPIGFLEHSSVVFFVTIVPVTFLAPLCLYCGRLRSMAEAAYKESHPAEHLAYLLGAVVVLIVLVVSGAGNKGGAMLFGYGIVLASLATTVRMGMWGTISTIAVLGLLFSHSIHAGWIVLVQPTLILSFAMEAAQGLLAFGFFATLLLAVAIERFKNEQRSSTMAAQRYRDVFYGAPVGFWELNQSAVKTWLDEQDLPSVDACAQFLSDNVGTFRALIADMPGRPNMEMARTYGFSSIEELVRHQQMLLDGAADEVLVDAWSRLYFGDKNVSRSIQRPIGDGRTLSLVMNYRVLPTEGDDWSQWLISVVDLTELEQGRKTISELSSQTEELSRLLLETEKVGKMGSWRKDTTSGELAWSPGMYELYDMDPDTPLEDEDGGLTRVHPADAEWLKRTLNNGMLDHHLRFRLLLPGGRVRWIESIGKLDYFEDDRTPILRGVQRDISDLVASSLEKSEVIDILETTSAVAYTAEGVSRAQPTYLSPGIGQYFFDREALLREPDKLFNYADPEAAANIRKTLTSLEPESAHIRLEYELETPVGRVWFRDFVRRRPGSSNGQPVFEGVLIDISSEKEALRLRQLESSRTAALLKLQELNTELGNAGFIESALAQAEALTQSSIAFFHYINPDEQSIHLTAWSRQTTEKYCSATYDDHYPVAQAGVWAEALRKRQAIIINDYEGHPGKRGLPQGHSSLSRLISLPVFHDGRVVAVCGVGSAEQDYTEDDVRSLSLIANEIWRLSVGTRQREAEKNLQARLEAFFDTVYDSFVIYQAYDEGQGFLVTYLNHAAEQTGGVPAERALNRDMTEVWPGVESSGIVDVVRQTWQTGNPHFEPEIHYTFEEVDQWFEMSVVRLLDDTVAVAYRDISEMVQARNDAKRLEKQLSAAQRMEALGRLAGGVAHDFNNLLGVILGNAEAGQLQIANREKVEDHLRAIESTALRSSDLTKQLLGFARRQIGEAKTIDVYAYLRELSTMIDRLIGENIVLSLRTGEGEAFMETDPSFIDQIVTNLCVNARDAIRGSGSITLSAEVVHRNEPETDWPSECNYDSYICIALQDNGIGISKEMQEHIFEPFFSTKEFGTGLGLSTVYGVVKQLNGCIDLTSEVGKGTTFRVFLPPKEAQNDSSD